jgi:hypothetical protein
VAHHDNLSRTPMLGRHTGNLTATFAALSAFCFSLLMTLFTVLTLWQRNAETGL